MMRAALAALMLGVSGAAAAASWPSAGTDPRFELLGVIQMLAGSDRAGAGVFRHDIPYVHLAEARFRRYVFHPVVERYAELTRGGLDYLSAYHFIYALGEPPELALREELPERLLERLGGRQGAEELRLLLSDFARTSRFEAFYRDTAAQRQAMTVSVEAQAAALDPRGRLTAYTGLPVEGRFALILSPFAEPSLAAAFLRAGAGAAAQGAGLRLRPGGLRGPRRVPAGDAPGLDMVGGPASPAEGGRRRSAGAASDRFRGRGAGPGLGGLS